MLKWYDVTYVAGPDSCHVRIRTHNLGNMYQRFFPFFQDFFLILQRSRYCGYHLLLLLFYWDFFECLLILLDSRVTSLRNNRFPCLSVTCSQPWKIIFFLVTIHCIPSVSWTWHDKAIFINSPFKQIFPACLFSKRARQEVGLSSQFSYTISRPKFSA